MTTQILDTKEEREGVPLATDGRRWPRSTKSANLRVIVLALASFAVGTGVFVVAGLLDGLAKEFSVPLGTAGQMVAVYALAYALLSPVLVTVTARLPRRRLLVGVLSLFALSNLAAALAPTFSLLLASRVAAASFAGICAPVVAAVATGLVAPEHRGRALSVVMSGVSLSWVVGVPAATLISEHFGWRAGFVLVSALAAVAAVGVGVLLPAIGGSAPSGRFGSRLAVVRRPAVLVTLAVTVLAMVAAFVVLTYVRALLEGLAGLQAGGVASMLLLFGLAGTAGSVFGGLGADRFGYRTTVVTVLMLLALSLCAFSVLAAIGAPFVAPVAAAALAAMAVAGFSLAPVQQYRLIRVAPDERSEVLALNEVASDLGQGLGAVLGSLVLQQASSGSLGWAGATCAAAALLLSFLGSRFSNKS
jgi:MFS transporter, DHA1 family, inner membrane transport protein